MLVLDQLKEFIEEGKGFVFPKWLEDENMKVYVRKGKHLINGELKITLDIASVQVVEHKRNQGIFKEFLAAAHELHNWEATYIENVFNEYLASFLVKNGWMPVNTKFPYSFVMMK